MWQNHSPLGGDIAACTSQTWTDAFPANLHVENTV